MKYLTITLFLIIFASCSCPEPLFKVQSAVGQYAVYPNKKTKVITKAEFKTLECKEIQIP